MKHLPIFNPVKKLLVLSVIFLLLFGTIFLAGPAGADTIESFNADVDVTGSPYWRFYRQGEGINSLATDYKLKGINDDAGTTHDVFCIQPDQYAQLSNGNYTILDFDDYYTEINDNPGLLNAAWIANAFFDDVFGDSGDTTIKSRAQAAIWEMLYMTSDNNISDDGGNFYLINTTDDNKDEIQDIIQTAVDAANEASTEGKPFGEFDFPTMKIAQLDGQQDYAFYRGGQNDNPVPEPATMLLFGAGLIGLAGVVRKKV